MRRPAGASPVVDCGRERVWPVTQIQGNVRLGVSALSYAGRLHVAVHCDVAAVPAGTLARTLRDEFDRIAALAGDGDLARA